MSNYKKLQHTEWDCKYHVIFIPKYRRKVLYGQIRRELGDVFRRLARQKESEIEVGHLMVDHVHMMISIPPKYAVAQVIGFMKGKSAINIARTYMGRRRNFSPVSRAEAPRSEFDFTAQYLARTFPCQRFADALAGIGA